MTVERETRRERSTANLSRDLSNYSKSSARRVLLSLTNHPLDFLLLVRTSAAPLTSTCDLLVLVRVKLHRCLLPDVGASDGGVGRWPLCFFSVLRSTGDRFRTLTSGSRRMGKRR